jgi:hypothetical protein
VNETLYQALTTSELDSDTVADRLGVDRKTVERWIAGRVPYPRYRRALASLLEVDEMNLWPEASRKTPPTHEGPVEIQAAYAHRWAVPRDEWRRLFQSAEHHIDIFAYAALFLAEDHGILRILANKAQAGVTIRILLGDPNSPRIAERGADEGIDDAIAAKIRNALTLYQPLTEIDDIEIRLQQTTLYASIYRADNDLLINIHVYGIPASAAPVLHITHTDDGDMASTYLASVERVWSCALPYRENPGAR